jgi:hypothetical protein
MSSDTPKKSPRNFSNQEESSIEIRQDAPAPPPAPPRNAVPRYYDEEFDLVARIRAAREAAEREMRKFGKVSEYEVRKVQGQRADLNYDDISVQYQAPSGETKTNVQKTDDGEES